MQTMCRFHVEIEMPSKAAAIAAMQCYEKFHEVGYEDPEWPSAFGDWIGDSEFHGVMVERWGSLLYVSDVDGSAELGFVEKLVPHLLGCYYPTGRVSFAWADASSNDQCRFGVTVMTATRVMQIEDTEIQNAMTENNPAVMSLGIEKAVVPRTREFA